MSGIRKVPAPEDGRVETGPTQFGDDWPGVFIRGDEAMRFVGALDAIDHPTILDIDTLLNLADLLRSALLRSAGETE